MFDSEYFRTNLQADIEATGANAAVEVHLVNGHTLRVSSVLSVHGEYVTLEVYRAPRGDGGHPAPWRGGSAAGAAEAAGATGGASPAEMLRAVVSYAAIVAITVVPARAESGTRVGFGA